MATQETYENIDRPYNQFLERDSQPGGGLPTAIQNAQSVANSGVNTPASGGGTAANSGDNGGVEQMSIKNDGNVGDVWIRNFIRSENWKPKKVGFNIEGQTGYAEFCDVYISGEIEALSGLIGGFTIGDTDLSATASGNKTILSSGTVSFASGPDGDPNIQITQAGRILVGADEPIVIDGVDKEIESNNYVSGAFGTGFHLDSDLLEVGNIACRGIFRTAVFQKDIVNVIAGSFVVAPNGDVLDADMTANDNSTLTIKGTVTLSANDILRIKEVNGTTSNDEWMRVMDISQAPTYVVARDLSGNYGADANPTWKKGSAVIDYGQSGQGGVYMTASDSSAPYLSVYDHTGSPWNSINTRLRLGNLNGFLGYSTDLYGIAIGETDKYLKYDPTNGLQVKGNITATTGAIGGWVIGATSLMDVAGAVGMSSEVTVGDDIRFWAGNAVPASAPFKVTEAGVLTSSSGSIGGWVIDATSIKDVAGVVGMSSAVTAGDDIRFWAGDATPGSAEFRVTEAGALTATSATITGVITANTGYIGGTGGWVINTGYINYNGMTAYNGTTVNGVFIGPTGIGLYSSASAYFRVSQAGVLSVSGGTITGGTIQTAAAGTARVVLNGASGALEGASGALEFVNAANEVKGYITISTDDTIIDADDNVFLSIGGTKHYGAYGGSFRPYDNGGHTLGTSGNYWSACYANQYFSNGAGGDDSSNLQIVTDVWAAWDGSERDLRQLYKTIDINGGIITAISGDTNELILNNVWNG